MSKNTKNFQDWKKSSTTSVTENELEEFDIPSREVIKQRKQRFDDDIRNTKR
jgi:Fe-S cluster biosynthesis and repair protein YggX